MDIFKTLETNIVSPNQLKALGVPSASIAVLEDGQISAHVITDGTEDADTVYQACSISKAITALAVARLADQGRITYDTKIVDHLHQSVIEHLADTETKHLLQYVTVGMLLSHTSGLSQGGFPGYEGNPPPVEDTLAGRTPSNTLRVRLQNFPGAQWSYSGGGFTVLQLVLEDVTGTSFSELMQDIVLRPLGMTRSWYGNKPSDERNYTKAHTSGSEHFPGGLEYHNLAELAAAGLWTTSTDLLKSIRAVQDSLYTESGFLKQNTAKKMLTRVEPGPAADGIGLGWFINDDFFGHGGTNYPGYNTYVGGARRADGKDAFSRIGFAIMTNSSLGHDVAIKQIASAIYYLKGWPRFVQLPSELEEDNHIPYAVADNSTAGSQWRDWVGNWGTDWRLVDRDGVPTWQYRSMSPLKLCVAAAPLRKFEDGREEVFYVAVKLRIGLRLTWTTNGVKAIEMLGEDSWGRRRVSQLLQNFKA